MGSDISAIGGPKNGPNQIGRSMQKKISKWDEIPFLFFFKYLYFTLESNQE